MIRKITAAVLLVCMALTLAGCSFTDYRSATAMAQDGDWNGARELFVSAGDYKDAAEKVTECDYHIALAYREDKKYDEAIAAFRELGEYEDAPELLLQCRYDKAQTLLDAGKYTDAEKEFADLGDYEDAAEKVKACGYGNAAALLSAGEYEKASEIFASLGDYEDAAEQNLECRYQMAVTLYEEEKYGEAAAIFLSLVNYKETDRYYVLCSLRADQNAFIDLFTVGMNLYYAQHGLSHQLAEITHEYDWDLREFCVDHLPSDDTNGVGVVFNHINKQYQSSARGNINHISVTAYTYKDSLVESTYASYLETAGTAMGVLNDSTDYEQFVTLVNDEIVKLMEALGDTEGNKSSTFVYDDYECTTALFWFGEIKQFVFTITIPELVEE